MLLDLWPLIQHYVTDEETGDGVDELAILTAAIPATEDAIAAELESAVIAVLAAGDTATAAEDASLAAQLVADEAAAGGDAQAVAALLAGGEDAAELDDGAPPALTLSFADEAVAVEGHDTVVALTGPAESAVAGDGQAVAALATDDDTAAGTEGDPFLTLTEGEVTTAVDEHALTVALAGAADQATSTDAQQPVAAVLADNEPGTATEGDPYLGLVGAEMGTVADEHAIAAQFTQADSADSRDSEVLPQAALVSDDAGALAAESEQLGLAGADSAAGAEEESPPQATITAGDTAAGAEAHAIATQLDSTEVAAALDAHLVLAGISGEGDTATSADAEALSALLPDAEVAGASEGEDYPRAFLAALEAALGVDAEGRLQRIYGGEHGALADDPSPTIEEELHGLIELAEEFLVPAGAELTAISTTAFGDDDERDLPEVVPTMNVT